MSNCRVTVVFALLTIAVLGQLACSKQASPPASGTTSPSVAQPAPLPALPSASDAATLIAESAEFGDFQFTLASFSLPMKSSMMNEPAKAAATDLRAAGWIRLDGSGNVSLTDKAKNDRRWLVRPNGFVELVPLAKKEFVQLDGVRAVENGDTVADFTWRWVANDVGKSFRSGLVKERFETTNHASATLKFLGGRWQVFLISATESGHSGK